MDSLEIEAHDVAHFEAVLKGFFFFKRFIICTELPEIIVNLAIERHSLIFKCLFL